MVNEGLPGGFAGGPEDVADIDRVVTPFVRVADLRLNGSGTTGKKNGSVGAGDELQIVETVTGSALGREPIR